MSDLLDECAQRSIDLLRANTGPAGIRAASPSPEADDRNYDAVFARDAAICALGMAGSGHEDLVRTAWAGLCTLARGQADSGEIPKLVRRHGEADFWYVACADATAWWLLAVELLGRQHPDVIVDAVIEAAVPRAQQWLRAQAHPTLHLVRQTEASDWADIFPRSGFVLYTNALWYWLRLLQAPKEAPQTRENARLLLYPHDGEDPPERRISVSRKWAREHTRPSAFWLSFADLGAWGTEHDVFGNVLAGLTGLMQPREALAMIDEAMEHGLDHPWPVRVVGEPIGREDARWRPYMNRHELNTPGRYHNGGIWPFVGAYWALLLHRLGRREAAEQALLRVAQTCRLGDWGFYEWLDGRTGEPQGMRGQSWNAAAFLMAYDLMAGRSALDPFETKE